VLKQCEHFAARVAKAGPLKKQIKEAYRLALNRPPHNRGIEKTHRVRAAPWHANLCRLIFNTSEFMFLD